eukprot:10699977-Alexandrium_andersonii.AAC.1
MRATADKEPAWHRRERARRPWATALTRLSTARPRLGQHHSAWRYSATQQWANARGEGAETVPQP